MNHIIKCPHCHKPVDVNEALSHKLQEHFEQKFQVQKSELEASFSSKEDELRKQLMSQITETVPVSR